MGEQGTTVHDEGGVCFWGDENAMQLEGCDDHTVCCECAENPLSHYFFCCVSLHLRCRLTRTNAHTRGSRTGHCGHLTVSTKLELQHLSQHSGLVEMRGDGKVPQEQGREAMTQQQFSKWETQGVRAPGRTEGHLLHFPAAPPEGDSVVTVQHAWVDRHTRPTPYSSQETFIH